jgi:hypothetical protein
MIRIGIQVSVSLLLGLGLFFGMYTTAFFEAVPSYFAPLEGWM